MSALSLSPVERAIVIDALEMAEAEVMSALLTMKERNPDSPLRSQFRDWLDVAIALKVKLRPPVSR